MIYDIPPIRANLDLIHLLLTQSGISQEQYSPIYQHVLELADISYKQGQIDSLNSTIGTTD